MSRLKQLEEIIFKEWQNKTREEIDQEMKTLMDHYAKVFEITPLDYKEVRFPYNVFIPLIAKDLNGLLYGYLISALISIEAYQFNLDKKSLQYFIDSYYHDKSFLFDDSKFQDFIECIRKTNTIEIVGYHDDTYQLEIIDQNLLKVFLLEKYLKLLKNNTNQKIN